ncbi:MAG: branched-chain-amino-acid transaminase [bacterium]
MNLKIYIDGKLVADDKAKISVFDHGLLYGDGVFEGIRAYSGRVFKLTEHIDRLYKSAKAIMLKIPLNKEEMEQAVLKTVRANNFQECYIRLVVTRGVGDLGLDPRKCLKASVIIIASKIHFFSEDFYKNGLKIMTVPTRRNSIESLNPNIKSLNYLNNILAKIEANNMNVLEAIMLDNNGYVVEGTGDNIFIINDKNELLTPPTYLGALKGITRDTIIDLSKNIGLTFREEILTRYDLYNAFECFLTGTACEVIPVINIDERIIGNGKPGINTVKLIKLFKEYVKTNGVKI